MIFAMLEQITYYHYFVGTEQILLGLIGEETVIAAKILKSMGINLKDSRVEVEKIIGRGSGCVAVEIIGRGSGYVAVEIIGRSSTTL